MQGVQLERVFEGLNGLRILLGLGVDAAEEVPGVGVVGIDFSDALEGSGGLVGLVGVFVEQAEVVPGVGVFGILFGGVFQQRSGVVDLLQIEQGDSAVKLGDVQGGILRTGRLDILEAGRFGGLGGGVVMGSAGSGCEDCGASGKQKCEKCNTGQSHNEGVLQNIL